MLNQIRFTLKPLTLRPESEANNLLFKVVALLERNERLPKPEKCPKGVYDLMLRCWSFKAKKRPAFRELAAIFRTQPEYTNIKPYFK